MSYGIADTIGRDGYLTTLDLIVPEFGGREDEALFAMCGLAQASPGNNVLSKYLHDNFASFLNEQLLQLKKPDQMGEQNSTWTTCEQSVVKAQ
jgi:adenylate cyclase